MEIKRSIEISVEKTRRFVIRQPETYAAIRCPACGELMLTAEASAVLFRVKCRRVYRIVEAGAAHFAETETGALFICPPSLAEILGDDRKQLSAGARESEPPIGNTIFVS